MEYKEAANKFAEVVATRTLFTTDALLRELNREQSALLFGKPVADLTEQMVKVTLAMENLSLVDHTECGAKLFKSLEERYVSLLAVLGRVHSSFHALSHASAG